MNIRRGDIIIADLGNTLGSEQGKKRPVVVIQNDIGNQFSPTTIVVPLTSQLKKVDQITHAIVRKSISNGLKHDSMVLCEQVRAIDKQRVCGKIGYIDDQDTMNKIFEAYVANF